MSIIHGIDFRPSILRSALIGALLCASIASVRADNDGPATEQWRPAIHYTPARNWMNDPNGLIWHDGVYHLFYQYNPSASHWGNMSWGHATSSDLVHWKEQPVAMANNTREEIFSGSIVFDKRNTSGLAVNGKPALVAVYTSVFKEGSGHESGVQAQSLAYSTDNGRTWKAYAKNPVLTLRPESKNFRDPKVSWYAPGGYWLMTTVVADAHVVKIYKSSNLIDWEFLSDFGPAGVAGNGVLWEMPDLFPLPLDGDANRPMWVMLVNINPGSIAGGSGVQYFVGTFDGKTFNAENLPVQGADLSEHRWLDHGADYYAAGTFADAPDGRRVTIAWMSNWDYADRVPTSPWRGAMALPRDLALRTIDGVPRLVSTPAREYLALVNGVAASRWKALTVRSTTKPLDLANRTAPQDIDLVVEPYTAKRAGIVVAAAADGSRQTRVYYDTKAGTLTVDRTRSGDTDFSPKLSGRHIVYLPLNQGKIHLKVVLDKSSLEVFAADGRTVITDLVFPKAGDDRISLFAEDGEARFSDIAVRPVR
ncbi:levanbiose-producing levanase [Luteibacter rhizovicinus]|uniref:Levanbiose-producing levanase n=1 Tax=Luteibacter rhizovicinus TaxID=242606 RepID=A0A4R3YKR6_9GAMM|nr:glycoside hydrolase family 32 protein [Luteibacter rhizovicinus]TCV93345.1 levanbiose-producing levanase [Luteibacter rhizovicinus]